MRRSRAMDRLKKKKNCYHSLLSGPRAGFDAIVPELAEILSRHRSGIARLWPLARGRRRSRRGRRPDGGPRSSDAAGGEDAIVLGNGYGGFVALQMAIRHPGIAAKLILADSGAAFSEPGRDAFRNMAAAAKAKGLSAITDVAMRRLFAPDFRLAIPS